MSLTPAAAVVLVRPTLAVAADALSEQTPEPATETSAAVQQRAEHLRTHLRLALEATPQADHAADAPQTHEEAETVLLGALALRLATSPAARQLPLFARFVHLLGSTYEGAPDPANDPTDSTPDTDGGLVQKTELGHAQPAVWVGCLASYNAGELHGRWVHLADEDLTEAIEDILASSPAPDAEEWHICDWEHLRGMARYMSVSDIEAQVALVTEHGVEVANAAVDLFGEAYAAAALAGGAFEGECTSPEDWAFDRLEQTGALASLPEELRGYFDYAAYARDAECNGLRFVEVAHDRFLVFGPR